jgi:hypothetical protein
MASARTLHIDKRHITKSFEEPEAPARSAESCALVHPDSSLVEFSDIEHDPPPSESFVPKLETGGHERGSQPSPGQIGS